MSSPNLYRCKLRLVREELLAEQPGRIRGPRDAVSYIRSYLEGEEYREQFGVILLDTQHHPRSIVTITTGILDASVIHPREVFQAALASPGTAAIILFHNHPSGDSTPSPEDKVVTSQLCDGGRILGIPILDHLIVGDGFTSMTEAGFMPDGKGGV